MTTFKGVNGQSVFDVCLNTYGSLDFLYKLLQDSGIANVNQGVYSGQAFSWEPTLLIDQQVNRSTTLSGKIFATAFGNNGSVYFITKEGGKTPQNSPFVPSAPQTSLSTYQKTTGIEVVATADDQTVFNIPELIGKTILQIEVEIRPTYAFTWVSGTGVLTMTNGVAKGQSLFILYQEMITA